MIEKILSLPLYFKLHVIFMAIMVIGLIKAVIISSIKKSKGVLFHRLLATTSLLLGIAGVVFMALFKELKGYSHLSKTHSQIGIIVVGLVIINVILGTRLIKGKTLLRTPHKTVGRIAVLLAVLTAVFGFIIIAGFK